MKMWSIPLKKYREREDKRTMNQQGWTRKESRKGEYKKKAEKMRTKEKIKSESIGLIYK